jgi:hypothetical protein
MKLVAWLSYLALVPYLICALVLVGSNYFLLKQTCSIAFIIIQLNSKVRINHYPDRTNCHSLILFLYW